MPTEVQQKLILKLKEMTQAKSQVGADLEALIGCIPEDDNHAQALLAKALNAYQGKQATKIVFDQSADHYDADKNRINIERKSESEDLAHAVLFESFNACQRQEYLSADNLKASKPGEFGMTKASIEAQATCDYNILLGVIAAQGGNPPMSNQAKRDLVENKGCTTRDAFLKKMTSGPHHPGATDERQLPTPLMYTYMAFEEYNSATAFGKIHDLLGVPPKEITEWRNFDSQFRTMWGRVQRRWRPLLLLAAAIHANDKFDRKLNANEIPRKLGFGPSMVRLALQQAGNYDPYRNRARIRPT